MFTRLMLTATLLPFTLALITNLPTDMTDGLNIIGKYDSNYAGLAQGKDLDAAFAAGSFEDGPSARAQGEAFNNDPVEVAATGRFGE